MTASTDPIHIETEDRVALVRFDTGHRANPLSVDAMHALHDAALRLARDPKLSAVVLTGTAAAFTYGFDLRDARRMAALPLDERREALSIGPRMCAAWERIEALTVAAVEGWCVGGGVALASALDLRVAGRSATFYVPEIERGMNMSWGSVPRLVNLLGAPRAKRVVMLAEKVTAPTAADWGFVDACVDDGTVVPRALELARRAASMPPVQLRMCKAGIDAHANALNGVAAALDRDQYLLAQVSADYAEGVAAFLEDRPPRWTGH